MIRAEATLYNENNDAECRCSISGKAEEIAVEYATITSGLIHAEGGQLILDRAMEIMQKEINEHEEKRSK